MLEIEKSRLSGGSNEKDRSSVSPVPSVWSSFGDKLLPSEGGRSIPAFSGRDPECDLVYKLRHETSGIRKERPLKK
jgi:hypothetical protein